MKLLNHLYEDMPSLHTFVEDHFHPQDHILIQLFFGDLDAQKIQAILDYLHESLPQSVLIGSTTAGEIFEGQIWHQHIVLSFCVLEHSVARVHYEREISVQSAQEVARQLLSIKTKACIVFAETLRGGDSESFIKELSRLAPHVVFAGGNAGDDFTFTKTQVLHGTRIENEGVVLATLEGESLRAYQDYSFGWTQIGKTMTVTKCEKGTVFELDHQPIEAVYRHYFGNEILATLPASSISFPLVKLKDQLDVCRAMIAVKADEAFLFAGHFQEGEKVRFAIANVDEIMHNAEHLQQKIHQNAVEALFIYSCSIRNLFLKEHMPYEFGLLRQIAPSVGFFTYGEFFHTHEENHLLNATTTVLALSESTFEPKALPKHTVSTDFSALKFLTHLVNTMQSELDDSITFLNQYKMALDHSALFSKVNLAGEITYVNQAFCTVTGYPREEILGTKQSRFRHPSADSLTYEVLWKTIQNQKTWNGILKCVNAKGGTYYLKSTIMPFIDDNGQTLEYISSSTDITELVVKDRIIQEQFVDELTGLGNRVALFYEMRQNSDEKVLALINLVGFSEINDYLGYGIGDALLKEIGALIRTHTQAFVHMFRLNGDEFAVLIHSNAKPSWKEEAHRKIRQIANELENHLFVLQGYEVVVRLNVGVALGKHETIYMQSHIALKEAKHQDLLIVSFDASDTLEQKTEHNIQIIHKIKKAIETDRIVPFYQGIYDNVQKKITKYEVLMRLQEEDGTYLSPYFFLEQAKKTRLYEKLTKIIIEKSFAYLADKEVDFTINLTKGDILSTSVKACLFEALSRYDCAKRVILEIVESEGIDNFEEIATFIREVKAVGCRIAIDDFGTGYSNFSYLPRLNVDFIKIDGSLIQEIDINPTKAMTVETIVSFAHKMQYQIVAEFVDKERIQTILEMLHVDFSQGYLFSQPDATIAL